MDRCNFGVSDNSIDLFVMTNEIANNVAKNVTKINIFSFRLSILFLDINM